jgi:hypothetical protein
VVILESNLDAEPKCIESRLQTTKKTSTMDKELNQTDEAGFEIVGLTVSKTALGGNELVSILRRVVE